MNFRRVARLVPRPLRRLAGGIPYVRRLRNRLYRLPSLPGPAPGELRAVVYLPTWSHWDVMRQRPHYVLDEFAGRGHPVYFVDPEEPAPRSDGGVHVVPDLAEVPASGVLLYVHYAPVEVQFRHFDRPAVLYDITDDLSIYAPEEGAAVPDAVRSHHLSVIASADVVSAASPGLTERYRPDRADIVEAVNGVDPELFATPHARPADLPEADPARPIAGYHGAIAGWRFDFGLFARVAAALPDWWFPLIGPIDPRVAARVEDIAELPNVIIYGERSSHELPAYIQAFDVGTMWYPVNPVTEAAVPMKLHEYMAAGLPTVSTPLPACVATPGVRTAATTAEYVAQLEAARTDAGDPSFRAATDAEIRSASWALRLEPVFAALEAKGLLRVGK